MSPRFVVLVDESRISSYSEIVNDSFCVRCKHSKYNVKFSKAGKSLFGNPNFAVLVNFIIL